MLRPLLRMNTSRSSYQRLPTMATPNRSVSSDELSQPTKSASNSRRIAPNQTRVARPRWMLHMQAVFWRVLMSLGMFFHRMAPPRPPKPDFSRVIQSTISGKPGSFTLNFYVPNDYNTQRRLWTNRPGLDVGDDELEEGGGAKPRRFSAAFSEVTQTIRRRSLSARRWGGYPVVLNFHGGGFTIGSPGDDARWCSTVVNECNAVVISVDYRLAPECPFPTAVEDGVDAVIYVHNHAEELGIDKTKIALSGFSSGANMCFTVPLRLWDELQGFPRDDIPSDSPSTNGSPTGKQRAERALHGNVIEEEPSSASSPSKGSDSDSTKFDPLEGGSDGLEPKDSVQSPVAGIFPAKQSARVREAKAIEDISIACIVPWYPPVDYTRTREHRRATCRRPDQEIPALFTDLFDESYLHPPDTISMDSPYLSPGVAPSALLKNALPHEIIMHTCEWDMLLEEGEEFNKRLTSPEIDKHVVYKMVEGVPHGWDKAPNPWKPTPGVREHYLRACKEMRRVLWPSSNRPAIERETTKGYPTAAPRGSVAHVR